MLSTPSKSASMGLGAAVLGGWSIAAHATEELIISAATRLSICRPLQCINSLFAGFQGLPVRIPGCVATAAPALGRLGHLPELDLVRKPLLGHA